MPLVFFSSSECKVGKFLTFPYALHRNSIDTMPDKIELDIQGQINLWDYITKHSLINCLVLLNVGQNKNKRSHSI